MNRDPASIPLPPSLPPTPPPLPDTQFGPRLSISSTLTSSPRSQSSASLHSVEHVTSTSSRSSRTQPELPEIKDHRLKRQLPGKLQTIATLLESKPPFSIMGCNQSADVQRFSSKENSLRFRRTDYSVNALRKKKGAPRKETRESDLSIQELPEDFQTSLNPIGNNDRAMERAPFTLTADGTQSQTSRSSIESVRLFRQFNDRIFESFTPIRFSRLELSDDPDINMRLVLLNAKLPFTFDNLRLNFLYHLHQTLYTLHLIFHKKVHSYPKDDVLSIIESNLLAYGHYYRSASLCPSAPMTLFCLRETFSFSRRRMKGNPFNFPLIINKNSFNDTSFLRILQSVHMEFEHLYRATFSEMVPVPFANSS